MILRLVVDVVRWSRLLRALDTLCVHWFVQPKKEGLLEPIAPQQIRACAPSLPDLREWNQRPRVLVSSLGRGLESGEGLRKALVPACRVAFSTTTTTTQRDRVAPRCPFKSCPAHPRIGRVTPPPRPPYRGHAVPPPGRTGGRVAPGLFGTAVPHDSSSYVCRPPAAPPLRLLSFLPSLVFRCPKSPHAHPA